MVLNSDTLNVVLEILQIPTIVVITTTMKLLVGAMVTPQIYLKNLQKVPSGLITTKKNLMVLLSKVLSSIPTFMVGVLYVMMDSLLKWNKPLIILLVMLLFLVKLELVVTTKWTLIQLFLEVPCVLVPKNASPIVQLLSTTLLKLDVLIVKI